MTFWGTFESMKDSSRPVAHPPETLEGWYLLTQIFRFDRRAWRTLPSGERGQLLKRATATLDSMTATSSADAEQMSDSGWTAVAKLIGSKADVMIMHFRPTLDGIGAAQAAVRSEQLFDYMIPEYNFLSVTEAGLYHLTAQLAREAAAEGANVTDPSFQERLAARSRGELQNPHVRRRLFPQLPPDMPYVCFYPMSKRRAVGQNWYALPLEERSRLMMGHGVTGRRYAGKVVQIISGAIGLDAWEWGVTLFANDPLEFKKLVTDMRFDEVSAEYAEFGDFYVGRVVPGVGIED